MCPSILALIPARGGSKGIPRKNLRPLGGKALLAYSIEQARATAAIARTVVSTDDAEIGAVAERFGAEVVWRPASLSTDTASSESALLHALDHLKERAGADPNAVVFLQVTSPLRQPHDIQRAIETFQREEADSLFSACRLHGFVWRQEGAELRGLSYDYRQRHRRQDGPVDLVENGSIYIFKPWVLRQCGNRLGGKIAIHQMHPLDSFQVDEPDDLLLMEQLLPLRWSSSVPVDLTKIKLLVLDFDGVFTDNRVLVDQHGVEAVWCHRGDGWGLERLRREVGLQLLVLSTEINPVVAARCAKLGLPYQQGCADKLATLQALCHERALSPDQVAYVGNDLNDLACMRWVGVSIAVADAVAEVRAAAYLRTRQPGGFGAVREVADLFWRARCGLDGAPDAAG